MINFIKKESAASTAPPPPPTTDNWGLTIEEHTPSSSLRLRQGFVEQAQNPPLSRGERSLSSLLAVRS
jgi:hypothetical protein